MKFRLGEIKRDHRDQKRSQEQSVKEEEEEQDTARTNERPSSAEPPAKLHRGNDFPDLDLTADEIAFINSEGIQVSKIDQNS